MNRQTQIQEQCQRLLPMRRTLGSSLRRRLCLVCLLVAGMHEPSVAEAAEAAAVRADDFLSSIGVCSAVSRRGESLSNTVNAAKYLGLRWFRAGYKSRIPVADLITLHKETDIRFSYGLMSGGTNITQLLNGARQLAAVGALLAFEGNNEPNNWGVTYEGQRGGHTNSWLPVAKLQRDLYRAVKSDPVLQDYPVWSLSENGAETDNVGLPFLAIPNGAGTLMPDDTRYADYANCHNYKTHPGWPGLHDNQTWIAADPTSACRVDGLCGNYGRTWRRRYTGYSEAALLTLPRVTTETGVTIQGAITEQVQALLYLSVYLDQFKRGWKHTAIYLLRDRTDEAGNQMINRCFSNALLVIATALAALAVTTATQASDLGVSPSGRHLTVQGKPFFGWAIRFGCSRRCRPENKSNSTGTVKLRLNKITGGDNLSARWTNPATGEERSAGTVDRQAHSFTPPPDWDDALLHVAAQKRSSPKP